VAGFYSERPMCIQFGRFTLMDYSGMRFELDRKAKLLICWPLVLFW